MPDAPVRRTAETRFIKMHLAQIGPFLLSMTLNLHINEAQEKRRIGDVQ